MKRLDRDGEINHDAALMYVNAQHPLKPIDRSNVLPRMNGVTVFTVGVLYTYELLPGAVFIDVEDEA